MSLDLVGLRVLHWTVLDEFEEGIQVQKADSVRFTRVVAGELHTERLPDGSVAIYDERSKSVHSLNRSAGIAWDACAQGATVEQVRQVLERHAGSPVDLEVAWTAMHRLQEAELVISDAPLAAPAVDLARRSALKSLGTFGAAAIPVVLTLTASEQRMYALQAVSGTTPPPGTTIAVTSTALATG